VRRCWYAVRLLGDGLSFKTRDQEGARSRGLRDIPCKDALIQSAGQNSCMIDKERFHLLIGALNDEVLRSSATFFTPQVSSRLRYGALDRSPLLASLAKAAGPFFCDDRRVLWVQPRQPFPVPWLGPLSSPRPWRPADAAEGG
jgi:hypothetical protein